MVGMPSGSTLSIGALRSRVPPALAVAFACFVGLGLYDGTLGTAWPSIRRSLSLPVGDLGLVQLAGTAGFLCSSAISGRISARVGRARALAAAAALGAGALAAYAASPGTAVLLLAAGLVGVAAGHLEPGMQSHVALTARARGMNLLHACYGIGATAGPLLISMLLVLGWSWRLAYLVLLGVDLAVALAVLRQRDEFDATTPSEPAASASRSHPGRHTTEAQSRLPRAALATSLSLFFVYCGVEVGTGQWAFTFFTVSRHLDAGLAGLLVAGYWGSLTLARLGTAALGERVAPELMLTLSAGGALVGEALLLWEPVTAVGAVGLLLTGASLAPVFPLMMTRTASWAGTARVSSVIGWQSAAAGIGVALPSALAGLLIERFGLGALMPYLWALAVLFLLLQLTALRTQGRRS
ncbi:MAG TPA: MFS transporter [Acidimicrobiales bacterium]|nr:MFS transporter [Acidimicrobiales bacterium]